MNAQRPLIFFGSSPTCTGKFGCFPIWAARGRYLVFGLAYRAEFSEEAFQPRMSLLGLSVGVGSSSSPGWVGWKEKTALRLWLQLRAVRYRICAHAQLDVLILSTVTDTGQRGSREGSVVSSLSGWPLACSCPVSSAAAAAVARVVAPSLALKSAWPMIAPPVPKNWGFGESRIFAIPPEGGLVLVLNTRKAGFI